MRQPVEASSYPSLADRPCLYPDGRSSTDRRPYLYRQGRIYPVRPHYEEAPTVGLAPVDLGRDIVPLEQALDRLACTPLTLRIPVLAVGSNAYPRQLFDKFEQHPVDDDSVVVLGCTLRGAGIAYCASLSLRNGYVPVSLQPIAGEETQTWIQWLTAEQLEVISRTEGSRYALVECGSTDDGTTAVSLHGIAAGPTTVYGWLFESLLTTSGSDEVARFSGSPPEGYSGDPRGIGQDELLEDIVGRALSGSGGTMTWDGCLIPAERRREIRDFLATRGIPNPVPGHWSVVDRGQPGFAQRMLAASG